MADELHAVVRLLLKRMESHPEEFIFGLSAPDVGIRSPRVSTNRWNSFVQDVSDWGNEADKAAIHEGLREIRLGEIHERVMDELINGEQRRADERRAFEEEEKRYNAMKQQPQLYGQAVQNSYQNTLTGAQVTSNNSITLGDAPLTEGMLPQIKKALGAK